MPDESRRIWERRLGPALDGTIDIPLRFRVVPSVWPDIVLAPAEGTQSDVSAPAYELRFRCDPGEMGWLLVDLAGFRFSLLGRTATVQGADYRVHGSGSIDVGMSIEGDRAELTIGELEPLVLTAMPLHRGAVSAVTTNIDGFVVDSRRPAVGAIEVGPGVEVGDGVIFGLREVESAAFRAALADGPGALFYESDRFSVFDGRVVETDGSPPALVADRTTIVSPIRVVEEFTWRETAFGDMTRVVDRRELWRSTLEPGRFPTLTTPFRTIDATFELALETFQRNSSTEIALPGQEGMWSAGYFQGSGEGFGVWRRDTSHVAIRCGNLLDPTVARASLAHVVDSGFDNGSDGDSLPAVAVWDHLLATGDESLVDETWPALAETVAALDSRFDERRGLVQAPQSTSNDLFDEPEAGGFALSTEVYAMQTYAAMSQMAALPGRADSRAEHWARRASTMRRAILEQYWNPEYGYFTSGPAGSDAFVRGLWETSGAEAALWGFLGEDAEPMTASVLDRMHAVAMSDFGVVLFPYKETDNHFCSSVWFCWEAGIARAAARVGDAALVRQLIGQQVRTVVRNKTFYEVTDALSGQSWRWPGQLWHAAGFASLVLFGLLGIRYDVDGMTFSPAVVPELDGARLDRLKYRAAELDVEIRGHGSRCEVTLDGRPVDRIPADISGRHAVVLAVR